MPAKDSHNFRTFHKPERISTALQAVSAGPTARPVPTTGPETREDYETRLRGSRRLAYSLLVLAFVVFVGIAYGAGWLP
jgi:hypothetical protein